MIASRTRAEARTNTNSELRVASTCSINSTWNQSDPSPSIDDDGIRLVVERHLQMSHYAPVRAVRCSVVRGVVTLYGMLPSFYMRQVAQALADCVESVVQVVNHCEVVYPHQIDLAPKVIR